ncbi:uncharacterized protein LOC123534262 [Mercenaria mercenaria]|uniref:uncharacterized protein LOC123534262 n=1 Tax=Mercenaria mercenaria TaxID=6596 RepID=UPI00234EC89F|nr:uncharacterized protein LOC123534262 [Mercenaria mercenaria]
MRAHKLILFCNKIFLVICLGLYSLILERLYFYGETLKKKNRISMSTYEDYNETSHIYDDQRMAAGTDVMAAMLQFYSGKKLQDVHILDAGCGTGNYAKEFADMDVGQITILDASSGMLEKAKCKLADYMARGVVKEVIEAKMPPIPFPDESFDAVVFNLLMNHLDIDNPAFPNSVKTLKESVRILRPNGLIIISTVLATTLSRATWYSQLNMELTNRHNASVLPSLEQFEQMFEDAGINCIQKLNILGSDIYKTYYNLDDILDESLRAPRAYWTFATKEEVAEVVQKVKALKAKGEYEKWVKEHDHTRTTGVVTIFFCKPN